MAENLYKVCKGGDWYNDTNEQRYKRLMESLDRYVNKDNHLVGFDYYDFQSYIGKQAVLGNIFFSNTVYDAINDNTCWPNYKSYTADWQNIINKIAANDTLKADGSFNEDLLRIRKIFDKSGIKLIFEHVIPAKVYIKRLVDLYKANKLTYDAFVDLRKNLCICIVTKEENDRLNEAKLTQKMPPEFDWDNNMIFDLRYKKVNISIHK